jgi:uncharacterized protein
MSPLNVFLPISAAGAAAPDSIDHKEQALRSLLRDLSSVVIGFSGGADSALLAKVAYEELGDRAVAVIALSESYPRREMRDALTLAEQIGVPVVTVEAREIEDERYASNPSNRCYYCKAELFKHLSAVAREREIPWIAYGANHDDLGDHRPGHVAAAEFGVRAPLLEVGLTKPEIRHISRRLGLSTWNKPAMACLSSRLPYGTRVTPDLLRRLDYAEDFLRHDLGFRQIRVRHHDTIARIEADPSEIARLLDPELRRAISERLKSLGYTYVAIELEGYRTGSLNASLPH